jgi:hypothetical protein
MRFLTGTGIGDPILFDGIRKVALIRDKPAKAKAFNEVFPRLMDWIKLGVYTAFQDRAGLEGKLELLGDVLNLGLESPQLKILMTDIEWSSAAVYNNVARQVSKSEINKLTQFTESQLLELKRLTAALRKEVMELNEVRGELNKVPH